MDKTIDPAKLADEIANIASACHDLEVALRLVDLADRLLTQAGLPPLPVSISSC